MLRLPLPVYWWRPNDWKQGDLDNYGDRLSGWIISAITGSKIYPVSYPKRNPWKWLPHIVSTGSIVKCAGKNSIVWGSGIIGAYEKVSIKFKNVYAVRGPETLRILKNKNIAPPVTSMTFGDPAVLLPLFFNPTVKIKHKFGLIVNHGEWDIFKTVEFPDDVKLINLMSNDLEKTTIEILECEYIFSSSLHGMIVPHAYGKWCLGIKLSNKLSGDGTKFKDWFDTCDIIEPAKHLINVPGLQFLSKSNISLTFDELLEFRRQWKRNESLSMHNPSMYTIKKMQLALLNSAPFKVKKEIIDKVQNIEIAKNIVKFT